LDAKTGSSLRMWPASLALGGRTEWMR
jgi:hypothetical protein